MAKNIYINIPDMAENYYSYAAPVLYSWQALKCYKRSNLQDYLKAKNEGGGFCCSVPPDRRNLPVARQIQPRSISLKSDR